MAGETNARRLPESKTPFCTKCHAKGDVAEEIDSRNWVLRCPVCGIEWVLRMNGDHSHDECEQVIRNGQKG